MTSVEVFEQEASSPHNPHGSAGTSVVAMPATHEPPTGYDGTHPVYASASVPHGPHRGFCFAEFRSHAAARAALFNLQGGAAGARSPLPMDASGGASRFQRECSDARSALLRAPHSLYISFLAMHSIHSHPLLRLQWSNCASTGPSRCTS